MALDSNAERRIGIYLAVGAVLGLAMLGTWWFVGNFERVEVDVRRGYSQEARRNPFLAAERYLAHLDLDVRSIAGRDLLLNPPSEPGTLIINNFGPDLSAARQTALIAWLRSGGHLIINATEFWDEDLGRSGSRFLDGFGVRLHYAGGDVPANTTNVEFHGYEQPVAVDFSPRYYLEDTTDEAYAGVAGGEGYYLLQFERGEGTLTVTSDNDFLTNADIGNNDHALYLGLLIMDPDRPVWLLYDTNMPSLMALLVKHAPQALTSLVVLILQYLWYLACRVGPLQEPPNRTRRDLMEHMDAMANYSWRIDRSKALLANTQARLEDAWIRKHYYLHGLERAERIEWIAERAGFSVADVEQALFGSVADERTLIDQALTQQALSRRL